MSESNARLELRASSCISDARLFKRYSLFLPRVVLDLGRSIEANETTRVFIPERKAQRGEALPERHDGGTMKHRVLGVASPKIVVRNAGAEMVHVMKADTAREPLQNRWKLEVRAPLDRRLGVVPVSVVLPVRTLELVLHEEQPEACHRREIVRGQVDEQDARPEQSHQGASDEEDRDVGRPDAHYLSPTHIRSPWRQALVHHEVERADEQKEDRVSDHPVSPPSTWCTREILAHGERVDVAVTAAIEIARGGVVQRVLTPPVLERHQRENTGHVPDDLIPPPRRDERAVGAVVHEDERPHEQGR